MLSSADQHLIAKDPRLKGLAILLDPSRLHALLKREYPGRITRVRTTYLRYKPGTSCLAGLRLECDGAAVDGYALTTTPEAHAKQRQRTTDSAPGGPLGTMGVVCETAPLLVRIFPNDPELPSLRRILTRPTGSSWPFGSHATTSMTVLRYKPQRRAVLRLQTDTDPVGCVAKVHAQNRYAAALRGAQLVTPTPEFTTATLIRHKPRAQTMLLEWVAGDTLSTLLLEPAWAPSDVTPVAEALHALHHRHYLAGEPSGIPSLRDHLHAMGPILTRLLPTRAREINTHIQSLIGSLEEFGQPTTTVHGDFYAKQVLLNRGRVGLLDFDQLGVGDPAEDLGCFRAHLERDVLRDRMTRGRASEIWEAFFLGYRSDALDWDQRVSLFTSIGILKLVPDPFRHLEPNWDARAEELFEASLEAFAPVLGLSRVGSCY